MWTKTIGLCALFLILTGGAAEQCTPSSNQPPLDYDVDLVLDKKNNPWKYDDIPDHLQQPNVGTPWPKIGDFARVYWDPATDRYYLRKAVNKYNLEQLGFPAGYRIFEGWEVKLIVSVDTYVIYTKTTVSYDPLGVTLLVVPQPGNPYGYWDDSNQLWVGLDYIGELEVKSQ